MAVITGNGGGETLTGSDRRDYLWGQGGNDTLRGGAGADYLYGGDGDDILLPSDKDAPQADGADRMDGGLGYDVADYADSAVKKGVTTRIDLSNALTGKGAAAGDSFSSVEGVRGTAGADDIHGTAARNGFYASAGGDRYDGRAGIDRYVGLEILEAGRVVTMEVAYGTRAKALVGSKVTLASGEGVAFYRSFADDNGNGRLDSGEKVTTRYDRLLSIEEVMGSSGDDTIAGTKKGDIFTGSYGHDRFDGGDGSDTVSYDITGLTFYSVQWGGVSIDLTEGSATKYNGAIDLLTSIENAIGTTASDDITGTAGRNALFGLAGNDALDGGGDADLLVGGGGDDILIGGAGDDVLAPGLSDDMVDGGSGIDTVTYAEAATSIAVNLSKNRGEIPIIDGVTITQAESSGDRFTDVENVDGSAYDDVLRGDGGTNRLTGLDGGDTLWGCDGDDELWGDADPSRTLPNLSDPRGETTDGGCDCCGDEEDEGPAASAAAHDDVLHGGEGDDRCYGGAGADLIYGGEGKDALDGGAGTDILYGGQGSDVLSGGAGFDFLFGGTGEDTVSYAASGAGVTVDLSSFWNNQGGDAASDFVADVLAQLASDGADQAIGGSSFLSLIVALGSDDENPLFSLAIPDVTTGVEDAEGSRYADKLSGNDGENRLTGGAGDDVLAGRGGSDVLVGGSGRDTLTGGSGADRFAFDDKEFGGKTAATADVITDFSHAQRDRIDLSAVDAKPGGSDTAFTFIGDAAFHGKAGELRAYFSGGDTFVAGDTDGDKKADFLIMLDGSHTLLKADFVL